MTGFTRTPLLMKAALIAVRPPALIPSVIPFQLNPENLTRTVEANAAEGEGGTETFRLAGAPKEVIKLETVFDAADDLERDDSTANEIGLHHRLAQLETLLYPQASVVIANSILLNVGTLQVLPEAGPFTIFIWGKSRILPVKISALNITEEAFDPNLNPIRAKVGMDLQVLSYSDLKTTHPGYAMFLAHQIVKETMSLIGQANSLGSVLGSDVKII